MHLYADHTSDHKRLFECECLKFKGWIETRFLFRRRPQNGGQNASYKKPAAQLLTMSGHYSYHGNPATTDGGLLAKFVPRRPCLLEQSMTVRGMNGEAAAATSLRTYSTNLYLPLALSHSLSLSGQLITRGYKPEPGLTYCGYKSWTNKWSWRKGGGDGSVSV